MSSWKLLSWNVNGVRAVAKKGFIEWLQDEAPDILCIQETKSQESQLDAKITDVDGYTSYWSEAEKKGYSGVGVYTRHEPISVEKGFGEERFEGLLREERRDDVVEHIRQEVSRFIGYAEQRDDVSLIELVCDKGHADEGYSVRMT